MGDSESFVLTSVSNAQGSVTEGKGRKLAGLEAVRFRNTIMRQTGFIEPDCADFSISYATGS